MSTVTSTTYHGIKFVESLESYTESALSGADYGGGELEAIRYRAQNNSRAIGRLLDLLFTKNIITANEVFDTLNKYCGEGDELLLSK